MNDTANPAERPADAPAYRLMKRRRSEAIFSAARIARAKAAAMGRGAGIVYRARIGGCCAGTEFLRPSHPVKHGGGRLYSLSPGWRFNGRSRQVVRTAAGSATLPGRRCAHLEAHHGPHDASGSGWQVGALRTRTGFSPSGARLAGAGGSHGPPDAPASRSWIIPRARCPTAPLRRYRRPWPRAGPRPCKDRRWHPAGGPRNSRSHSARRQAVSGSRRRGPHCRP